MAEHQTVAGSEPSAQAPHEPRTIRSEALMMSEIGDGVFVQWGDCAACRQRVTSCRCATGPVEPAHIRRWREGRFDPEISTRMPREKQPEHDDTSVATPLDTRPNGDNGGHLPTSEEDPDEQRP